MFHIFKSPEMTYRLVTHNPIWKGIQPKDKLRPCKRTNRNHGRVVKQLKQSRIPIVRVRWNSWISSPFHQYVFRNQHKLNFGTKFLLEGKTVTTYHFRLFQVISRTLEKHYSSNTIHQNTIHQNTIHQFTIHHFWCQFDLPRSIQKFYYSLNTIHCRKRFHNSRALFISS
jgi:hypothetical protein